MLKESLVQSLPPDFEGVGIELTLAAVDFADGSKDIPATEYGYLNQAAEAVKKYAKNYYVILKSYATDSEDADDNLKLSVDRAMAIKDYLLTQGVPEEFIYATGYGDGEYTGVARKEEAQKNGRRVEVELLTK
jgi:OmpA-OmpF porin, OOP family